MRALRVYRWIRGRVLRIDQCRILIWISQRLRAGIVQQESEGKAGRLYLFIVLFLVAVTAVDVFLPCLEY